MPSAGPRIAAPRRRPSYQLGTACSGRRGWCVVAHVAGGRWRADGGGGPRFRIAAGDGDLGAEFGIAPAMPVMPLVPPATNAVLPARRLSLNALMYVSWRGHADGAVEAQRLYIEIGVARKFEDRTAGFPRRLGTEPTPQGTHTFCGAERQRRGKMPGMIEFTRMPTCIRSRAIGRTRPFRRLGRAVDDLPDLRVLRRDRCGEA